MEKFYKISKKEYLEQLRKLKNQVDCAIKCIENGMDYDYDYIWWVSDIEKISSELFDMFMESDMKELRYLSNPSKDIDDTLFEYEVLRGK